MKRMMIIFGLLITCFPCFSQQSTGSAYTQGGYDRVFTVPNREALDIYVMAKSFATGKNFKYEQNPVDNSIELLVPVGNKGGNNNCTNALNVFAKIVIQSKNGKTRILLKDATYTLKEKAILDCPSQSGSVEDLFNCTACEGNFDGLDGAIRTNFNQCAREYMDYLKIRLRTDREQGVSAK